MLTLCPNAAGYSGLVDSRPDQTVAVARRFVGECHFHYFAHVYILSSIRFVRASRLFGVQSLVTPGLSGRVADLRD